MLLDRQFQRVRRHQSVFWRGQFGCWCDVSFRSCDSNSQEAIGILSQGYGEWLLPIVFRDRR